MFLVQLLILVDLLLMLLLLLFASWRSGLDEKVIQLSLVISLPNFHYLSSKKVEK